MANTKTKTRPIIWFGSKFEQFYKITFMRSRKLIRKMKQGWGKERFIRGLMSGSK